MQRVEPVRVVGHQGGGTLAIVLATTATVTTSALVAATVTTFAWATATVTTFAWATATASVSAEIEEAFEDAPDAGDVVGDALLGQQLPARVLARRVPDLGGAASHEDDGPVAGALHVPQQHDRTRLPTCRESAVASNPM